MKITNKRVWLVCGIITVVGSILLTSEDLEFQLTLLKALLGSSTNQEKLAEMYDHGTHTKRSPSEAFRWYQKARFSGNAAAQCALGEMFLYGRGVNKDEPYGVSLYQMSAKQGFIPAERALGFAYLNGMGIAKDNNLGKLWLKKAADGGDSEAMNFFNNTLEEGANNVSGNDNGSIGISSQEFESRIRSNDPNELKLLSIRGKHRTYTLFNGDFKISTDSLDDDNLVHIHLMKNRRLTDADKGIYELDCSFVAIVMTVAPTITKEDANDMFVELLKNAKENIYHISYKTLNKQITILCLFNRAKGNTAGMLGFSFAKNATCYADHPEWGKE